MRKSRWRRVWSTLDLFAVLLLASLLTLYVGSRLSELNKLALSRIDLLVLWSELAVFFMILATLMALIVQTALTMLKELLAKIYKRNMESWRNPVWWNPFLLCSIFIAFFLLFDKQLLPVYFSDHLWATKWRDLYWIYLLKIAGYSFLSFFLGLVFQLAYFLLRREGIRLVLIVSFGLVFASLGFSLVGVRPPIPVLPSPDPSKKIEPYDTETNVLLVGWDGATWSVLDKLREAGQVPTLERMMKSGAWASLKTLSSGNSAMIWNTVSTGRKPSAHGVSSFTEYQFPFMDHPIESHYAGAETRLLNKLCHASWFGFRPFFFINYGPVPSTRNQCPSMWELVRESGMKDYQVGLLDWFGTTPAEIVPGFVFADGFYSQYSKDRAAGQIRDASAYQYLLHWDVRDIDLTSQLDIAWQAVQEYKGPYRESVEGMLNVDRDRFYANLAPPLLKVIRPRLALVAFYGADSLGHYFWPYWQPQYYPDRFRQELSRYHDVLPGYYQYLDTVLENLVSAMGPKTTVLVISDHGMEPVIGCSEYQRANHDNRTPGMLVAWGQHIKQGAGSVENATVLDIAPTILYLLGFPVSEELGGKKREGRVLTEIIDNDFLTSYPVRMVPSYGPRLPKVPEVQSNHEVERDRLKILMQLGYLQ